MFQGKWWDDVVREIVSGAASGRAKGYDDEGYREGRVLMRLMLLPLELRTHRVLVERFPFFGGDLPFYVHRLIAEHGNDSLPLIQELLLRLDLDLGDPPGDGKWLPNPFEIARVLRLVAGQPSDTSEGHAMPPNWQPGDDMAPKMRIDPLAWEQLPRPPAPLDEQQVALLAANLLRTIEFTEVESNRMLLGAEYATKDSRFVPHTAALLALAHRIPHLTRCHGSSTPA